MSTEISTIKEYIQQFEDNKKEVLETIYAYIQSIVPAESTETISYQMPTFRYHGNLVHFAMFKNHWGLYPGSEIIEIFKEDLINYKTTKGAIQFPIDVNIPKDIIEKIITYKVDQVEDKTGPLWHINRDKWIEANEQMNELIRTFDLKKEFKWGMDIYTYQGKNVVAWCGFKDFFSIWFYNGVFLNDPLQVLISGTKGKTKALRQWRFKKNASLDIQNISLYIKEAMQTVVEGLELTIDKNAPIEMDDFFVNHLNINKELKTSFDTLTKGRQREYSEYIAEAKQEKTKISRLEKITPMIMEGKGLNDKYKR